MTKRIQEQLSELNRQMSTYIESSEISCLNKLEEGVSLSISPWFAHVLKYSLDLAKKSAGVFDPTLGPLVNLWGFGPLGPQKQPSDDQVRQALKATGYNLLSLESLKVTKSARGVYV